MQTSHPSIAPDYYKEVGNHRMGSREIRTLLNGKEGALDNYRMGFSKGESTDGWSAPRHRHPFEQVRLPLTGDYVIGKDEILPAGWVGYFPESAYYGPQVMSPNLTMVVLQYGGPSGTGYRSVRQRKEAFAALSAKGKFEGGAYTWVDEQGKKHNQDSAEAVWEYINKRKLVYPEARFRSLVLMNPAAFNWVKDDAQSGVARKLLGRFSERDIRIDLVRVEKGASLTFGTHKASEILFLKEGALSHEGKDYGDYSAFATEPAEQPTTLRATAPSECLYVKLPTF